MIVKPKSSLSQNYIISWGWPLDVSFYCAWLWLKIVKIGVNFFILFMLCNVYTNLLSFVPGHPGLRDHDAGLAWPPPALWTTRLLGRGQGGKGGQEQSGDQGEKHCQHSGTYICISDYSSVNSRIEKIRQTLRLVLGFISVKLIREQELADSWHESYVFHVACSFQTPIGRKGRRLRKNIL